MAEQGAVIQIHQQNRFGPLPLQLWKVPITIATGETGITVEAPAKMAGKAVEAWIDPGTLTAAATIQVYDDVDEMTAKNYIVNYTVPNPAVETKGALVESCLVCGRLTCVVASATAGDSFTLYVFVDTGSSVASHSEDTVHESGDAGLLILGVREDNPYERTSADGDYAALALDEHDCLWVNNQVHFDIQECNDYTAWAALNSDTTSIASSLNHVFGTSAVSFAKVNGAADTIFGCITDTITSIDLGDAMEYGGFVGYSLYVSSTANIAYAFLRLGTSASHYNEWRWDDDDLAADWNHLRAPIGQPSYAGNTGNGWNPHAITYVAVGVAFDAETNALAGIVVDHVYAVAGRLTQTDITSSVTSTVTTPNVNIQRVGNSAASVTGNGTVGGGTQRVTIASDSTGVVGLSSAVHPDGLGTVAVGERQGSATAAQFANVAAQFVRMKACVSNVGNVYIGGSGVTKPDGTTDTTTGLELAPGDDTGWLPASNLNLFYLICDNATDDVTYMVIT